MGYLAEAGWLGNQWRYGHGGGWWAVGALLWLLVLAAAVAGVVFLALRASGRPIGGGRPAPAGPAVDPAASELRLRYARGEVGRDEYLRTAADLGVAVPDEPAPPST